MFDKQCFGLCPFRSTFNQKIKNIYISFQNLQFLFNWEVFDKEDSINSTCMYVLQPVCFNSDNWIFLWRIKNISRGHLFNSSCFLVFNY